MPPPAEVLAAFGIDVRAHARLLPGGQGRTFGVDDAVLKPIDEVGEHAWVAEVFASWPGDAPVRVPQPLRADDGGWVVAGWGAHRFLPGETVRIASEPGQVREASDAFHGVLAHLPRADFLDARDDPWSFGDRVAWDSVEPVGDPVTVALVEEARAAYGEVVGPAQMVHGDIGGNVLSRVAGRLAVIDFPPYWRPTGFALAVAAIDALCWEGVRPALLDRWSDIEDWDQLLLRALVYRAATVGRTEQLGVAKMAPDAHAARVRPVLDLLI